KRAVEQHPKGGPPIRQDSRLSSSFPQWLTGKCMSLQQRNWTFMGSYLEQSAFETTHFRSLPESGSRRTLFALGGCLWLHPGFCENQSIYRLEALGHVYLRRACRRPVARMFSCAQRQDWRRIAHDRITMNV